MMKMIIDKNTFVISDTHFGHQNIIKYEPIREVITKEQDFSNCEQMMIVNWNKVVKPNDIVFHLGDFAFNDIEKYAKKLNGKKILLRGNHDKQKDLEVLRNLNWKIIEQVEINLNEKYEISIDSKYINSLLCCYIADIENKRIMFSHFPVFDDNEYDEKFSHIKNKLEEIYIDLECDLNIHGHIHSNITKEKFSKNVSVEKIGFQPIILSNLL